MSIILNEVIHIGEIIITKNRKCNKTINLDDFSKIYDLDAIKELPIVTVTSAESVTRTSAMIEELNRMKYEKEKDKLTLLNKPLIMQRKQIIG